MLGKNIQTSRFDKANCRSIAITWVVCAATIALGLATWLSTGENSGVIVAAGTMLTVLFAKIFSSVSKAPSQRTANIRSAQLLEPSTNPPVKNNNQAIAEPAKPADTSNAPTNHADDLADQREHLAHVTRLSTLGEMAASLAHEINQPLTAITTYSHACSRMMKAEELDRELLLETLEKTANQALRAGEVVRRLRNFVNKRPTERLPCDAHTLLDDVIRLAEVDARSHSLQLNVTMGQSLPMVVVDQVQVQQVLLNLIRNAMEATRASERFDQAIEINVQCDGRGWLHIEVVDSGIGVNPENIEQLFTPFFTTKTEGMGIGLSVSSSIIEAHGGKLLHRANPNGGAIFYFTLPSAAESTGE